VSTVRAIVAAAGLIAAAAVDASGQGAAPTRNACLDSIPLSAMRRVSVFVSPRLADSAGAGVAVLARLVTLTEEAAQLARTMLGAEGSALPPGEPRVGWRSLEADLHLVSHRDGRTTWRVDSLNGPDDVRLDDAGAILLAHAFDSLLARGRRLAFPESFSGDSIVWHLVLSPGAVDSTGRTSTPTLGFGASVFSVMMPPWRHVRPERVRVRYPEIVRKQGNTGRVVMDFVVDTLGRAVPSTVRDIRSAGESGSSGSEQVMYGRLVAETRRAVLSGRFAPAVIAGCTVRERVRQPFDFRLYDGRNIP
jgi:hypothetical protein